MKKQCLFVMVLLSGILFTSCNKEDVVNSGDNIGHSRIVYFPVLNTKGDRLVVIKQGDTYTDQGALATLNEQAAQFTTSGTVDATKPGIYSINYETKNPEGFSATDFRTVVVIGTDVPATRDFSGTYARYVGGTANGQTSTWTKTATGVYTVVNPGGATGVTATAVNYTGNIIAVPLQMTSAGPFSSSGGVYNLTAVPPQYQWIIVNAGYGTAVRTFIKQ